MASTPAAQAALDQLGAVVRDHASSIVLEAGDLLVVDNDRVVHGRTSFAARFDGTDRWLQRAFVVADLALSSAEHAGRIITTRSDPARRIADAGSEQLPDRVDTQAGECADDRPVDADELQVGPEQQLEPPRGLVGVPPCDRPADE